MRGQTKLKSTEKKKKTQSQNRKKRYEIGRWHPTESGPGRVVVCRGRKRTGF